MIVKSFCFLILLVVILVVFAPTPADAVKVRYDQISPVQWNDFKGPVDPTSEFSASMWSGTSGIWEWNRLQSFQCVYQIVKFEAWSYMDTDKSWVLPGKETNDLLNHEQKHLDISEIFARKMNLELDKYLYQERGCPSNYSTNDISNEVRNLFDSIFNPLKDARKEFNEEYDDGANHGRDPIKQAGWTVKIDCLLENYHQSNTCNVKRSDFTTNPGGTLTGTLWNEGGTKTFNGWAEASGDVKGWVSPSTANFGTLSSGDKSEVPYTITVPANQNPGTYNLLWTFNCQFLDNTKCLTTTILQFVIDVELGQVTPTPTPDEPKDYRFSVIAGESQTQTLTRVALETNTSPIRVWADASGTAAIWLAPKHLDFGMLNPGEKYTAEYTISVPSTVTPKSYDLVWTVGCETSTGSCGSNTLKYTVEVKPPISTQIPENPPEIVEEKPTPPPTTTTTTHPTITEETVKVEHKGQVIFVDTELTNGSIGSIEVDEDVTSIVIFTKTSVTDKGELKITLPRNLIDWRTNGGDDEFIVLVDSVEVDFEETDTTRSSRTLVIPVAAGTEKIEIIGTEVIPEFGILATLVLAVAVGVIIAISRKNAIQNTLIR